MIIINNVYCINRKIIYSIKLKIKTRILNIIRNLNFKYVVQTSSSKMYKYKTVI